jgi:outer membrane protein assembly factor BamB
VGAPAESADTTTAAAGHAYLFDATTGDLISGLTSPHPQAHGGFGSSVAINENDPIAVVGAPFENLDTTTALAGHAYLFDATTGDLISTLTSTDPQDGEIFGFSVGVFVDDATVIVGAPGLGDSFFREAAPRGVLDIATVFGGHAYLF